MTYSIEVNHAKDEGQRRSVERSPTGHIGREYVSGSPGAHTVVHSMTGACPTARDGVGVKYSMQ
jgi:hypothetical protein